ncbi:MAG: tetratricopeptide repeat protein [Acidobacteriia bacterium]|nr:tetratricopeptide repeat protein [Terriglobia bacterium]
MQWKFWFEESVMGRKTVISLVAAALLLGMATGCTQLKARDQLNKGVHAFKLAKYAEAVEHFKVATDLDPTFPTARLYLATAYMSQYIPGADSPENVEMAKNAYDQFAKVLEQDDKNGVAIASIASMYFHQKKWAEAEQWYKRLAKADPSNKEGLYTMGVIAWTKSFQKRMEARAKMSMKPEDPGPLKDKKVREELNAELLPVINEGMQHLESALKIDPEYDDAMAYLNLLHRERADLQESAELYKQDTDTADNWVQKTLETKKIKAAKLSKATPGGIVQDAK